MKLCMIGTGYVGLVSGVCFSDLGNEVICVDKDQDKINNLKQGIIPIYEPGLEELVLKNYKNKKLKFSTNLNNSIKKSDIVFTTRHLGEPLDRTDKLNTVIQYDAAPASHALLYKGCVPFVARHTHDPCLQHKPLNHRIGSFLRAREKQNYFQI